MSGLTVSVPCNILETEVLGAVEDSVKPCMGVEGQHNVVYEIAMTSLLNVFELGELKYSDVSS